MKFWENRIIFITGANGFLGSHLVKRALAYNAKVIVLIKEDIRSSLFSIEGLGRKCKVYKGGLRNSRLINSIFKDNAIDVCFHLAAQAIVSTANNSPLGTFKTNIEGTWNILEAGRVFGVKAMAIASTDKAYGEHKQRPYDEASPLSTLYPYYASKFCADILSRTYAHTYKLPVAVTRCANIYGPGDFNFSRIVPDTCFSVIRGENPVIKSDGSAIKDYAFVEDIVEAYFILAKSLINKRIDFGEAFNLGTGKPISVANLVKMIIKVSGNKKLNPEILGKGENKGKIVKHYFSSAKAKRILGWQSEYSLKRGLEITYKWYRDHIKH